MTDSFCRRVLIAAAVAAVAFFAVVPPSVAAEPGSDLFSMAAKLQAEGALDEPKDILVWIEAPRVVKPGERATLKVSIENWRAKDALRLSSVDIADGFLKGFEIESITPEPRNKEHSLGTLSLEFPQDVKPNESLDIAIALRAKKAGVYVGDVDVAEGSKFLTRAAQVRVKP